MFKNLWKLIVSLLASVICTLAFMALPNIPILKPWLGLVMESTPEWYMNAYYSIVNSTKTKPECPDILILDLNEKMTRQDVAELLMLVSTSNPRSVGVDCTFANSDTYDSLQTAALIDSISVLPKDFPIVFAAVSNEQSALPDSIIRHKGIVNFSGFYQFSPYIEKMPHLTIEMARLAGYDVSRIDPSSFVVNYRKKMFPSIPIYRGFMEDSVYLRERIQDQMVLIGGLNNRHDVRYVPFLIESYDPSMAGTQIVAYMLSSVISASTNEHFEDKRIFHYYSRCTWWENLILVVLLMFCYLWAYVLIDNYQEKHPWIVIIKPMWLFIMMLLMVMISVAYTAFWFRIPNIMFFMVMTVFMGPSYDMVKQWTKKE